MEPLPHLAQTQVSLHACTCCRPLLKKALQAQTDCKPAKCNSKQQAWPRDTHRPMLREPLCIRLPRGLRHQAGRSHQLGAHHGCALRQVGAGLPIRGCALAPCCACCSCCWHHGGYTGEPLPLLATSCSLHEVQLMHVLALHMRWAASVFLVKAF